MKVNQQRQRGTVLVAVIVVVAMLSLGAYSLTHWMTVESDLAVVEADRVQARLLSDSGVAYALALSAQGQASALIGSEDDVESVAGLVGLNISDAGDSLSTLSFGTGTSDLRTDAEHAKMFSIFTSKTADQQQTATAAVANAGSTGQETVRFFAAPEGGKINLNFWIQQDDQTLREVLLSLPEATPELVDAVMDWLDADSLTRESGAEAEDYAEQTTGVSPANGPIATLDELLQVRGMTAKILFGEDSNQNGKLDPNENDGVALPPIDDQDDELSLGWAQYLTVSTRDSLRSTNGNAKIYLNEPDLATLYRQIESAFDTAFARYVIAYRLFPNAGSVTSATQVDSATDALAPEEEQDASDLIEEEYLRTYQITTPLEMIGTSVEGQWESQMVSMSCPYNWEDEAILETVEKLLDLCTVDFPDSRPGRLDLSNANEVTIKILSGLTEEQRTAILDSEVKQTGAESNAISYSSIAWLAKEAILTPQELVGLSRVATMSSPVIIFQTLGHVQNKPVTSRQQVCLDTESQQVLWVKPLDRAGRTGLDWISTTVPRPLTSGDNQLQGTTP